MNIEIKSKDDALTMELIDKVLEQIKKDVEMGDITAIEELLVEVSEKNLLSFLEEQHA